MDRIGATCIVALILSVAIYYRVQTSHLEARLVRAQPDEVAADPELKKFAQAVAPAVYREHCATCHGANLQGDRSRGAPNLADRVWLYGNGSVSDIETTILYGIRSGHPKAHNLTDMPALGRTGQLTPQDIRDVVELVLKLSGQPRDDTAVGRGRAIFDGAGLCYDCHGGDALGISDYGTPALNGLGGAWLYGGDRDTLYKSVYDGRHGLCPAWIGKLSFVQIRALALYFYEKSHHE
jgi:cytochrome c oxidase cbb3-type subunit III